MYYVDRSQIERRLDLLPRISQVLAETAAADEDKLMLRFAEERALHLAIEAITDVGSYLIDGFIMRDASSYEDIVEIMRDESVIDHELALQLTGLVRLRKPLVQEYVDWDRSHAHELSAALPGLLRAFSIRVKAYLDQEGIQAYIG